MALLIPPHWYGLAVDPNYYKFAACTVTGEDARFFDSKALNNPFGRHGDAVCTVDCLMSNKNAILQLLFFPSQEDKKIKDCPAYITDYNNPFDPHPFKPVKYNDALLEDTTINRGPIPFVSVSCTDVGFSNLQAGNWMDRVQIWNITWNTFLPPVDNNLFPPSSPTLYFPNLSGRGVYGGSLYAGDYFSVQAWRAIYNPNAILDVINDIMTACTTATDTAQQRQTLDKCRDIYTTALGTTQVGPLGPIPVIPVQNDLIPSMYPGCQYVYDISGQEGGKFGTGCPAIDEMCQNSAMRGIWRHSLSQLGPDDRMNALPKHFCQNFAFALDPTISPGVPWVTKSGSPSTPDVSNFYLAGLGRQPEANKLIGSIEPQSSSAYVYRSCALQEYSATPEYCCANDFADGEGGVIFDPQAGQSPPVDPSLPVGYHRTPLIGYNYDTVTPWYKSCFDRNGLTCSPLFRDIAGDGCQVLMQNHCSINPDTSSPDSWNVNATDGSCECSRWLGRLLYGSGGQWINFLNAVINRQTLQDNVGTKLSFGVLKEITDNFHKVFTMQNIKDKNLSPLGAAMEPVVFSLYYSYNLNLYDGGVLVNQCGVFTIDDLTNNPMLKRWCGCMLLSTSYSSVYPAVSSACTPPCNSSDVIQYGIPCQGTLCVLDRITVNLVDSTTVGGVVSLSQICQSCGQSYTSDTQNVKQTCDCIVDNTVITAIDSILGSITIQEICGKTGNGGGKPAPSTKPPVTTRAVRAAGSVSQTFPYTAAALLVVAGVLALVSYVLSKQTSRSSSWRLWGRGFAIGFLILAIILFVAAVYSVVVLTID